MKVAPHVIDILRRAEILPNGIRIVEQLERGVYAEVNKALAAAGFKWAKGPKCHQHESEESETALRQLIDTGEVTTAQDIGFFETTGATLDRVIALAHLEPGLSVLEPSAGTGNMVQRILDAGCRVLAVEFLPRNFKQLAMNITGDGLVALCCDFLALDIPDLFDRVVMNPPFAKQVDMDHVLRALAFLRPGGRLVAVMAAGVTFRENRKTQAFREAIAAHDPVFEALPAGSFKASGTDVNTVILTLVKAS
ncbi:methyltransferase type 11 [Asticcacaulis biprosthecium C19]|uniref:Methyltransferase type 11 n=1 Tax=Asticcacaulis biprosthecium C19 TaxID=715226 RepID=F4QJ14_9CAUL|nr:methyltransferase domain-containing protein [Asticcacaulis biprosthecium]EGF93077.1 methyltransferase type 11 [Asticcacaulis biprosthecium C19]